MLSASLADISGLLSNVILALADDVFHPPDWGAVYPQMLLRWLHFFAGIVWIGHLYFFNFVNVKFMASLDAPTKGKVIPQLMPRALWWFRWGAAVTVLVGLIYYAMYILAPDARNNGKSPWPILLIWLVIAIITFAVIFFLLRSINKPGQGWLLGVVVTVVVALMAVAIIYYLDSSMDGEASNKSHSIGIGGALGIIMLFNVWGIIWPNQKRIISWTADNAENGTAIPAQSAGLARVAFLASRVNTFLSIPMLFFMAASSHFEGLLG
jgi:uncharacterized membrane protein